MSNSMMPGGEEAVWAQTFITVTPQDDGYLREIEENVVVSGSSDTPLHLDTRNIVLRRSLINNTKDWIDSTELEQRRRVPAECQTYLQGVPNVELPPVYREEATQTLYMGRDSQSAVVPLKYFDDIISVLNEKSMPELKASHKVQTIITMKGGASESDVTDILARSEDEMIANDSQSSITSEEENAIIEASDILNFIVERTLWITKSESVTKREMIDANVETSIKYNHRTKKLTIDYETQTKLTCKPEHSNSMLLADYNETKNFCRARVSECMEKGVYPKIAIENIVEEIMMKCKSQRDFPFEEKLSINEEKKEISTKYNSQKCVCRIKDKVNIVAPTTTNGLPLKYSVVRRDSSSKSYLLPTMEHRIVSTSGTSSESTTSTSESSFSQNSQQTSSSETSLKSADKQALGILKNAFCNRDTSAKR